VRGYFVTGTDTSVGKTFVTAALARRACESGQKVFAFKPVETGCPEVGGVLVGPDQEILARAAGDWQSGDLRGCYRLRQPAAPRVAAESEGLELDLERIGTALRHGVAQSDLVLVEGAGGWRVPITRTADTSDLAMMGPLPVIVVARAGLGTINHTLLTVEAVERDDLHVAHVVLSLRPEDAPAFANSNAAEILSAWRGSVLVYAGEDSVLDTVLRV
jgi:dethiobiotin synthetase